jgi:hypothetical protein
VNQLSDGLLTVLNNAFTWVGIVGAFAALVSMVGLCFVGDEIGSRKDKQVTELKETADAGKEYHDVAMLNLVGKPFPDGDIEFNTPISDALKGTYTLNGTVAVFHSDEKAEAAFKSVIQFYPKFPFAYMTLGVILRKRGDVAWKSYYLQAETILEKTTLVPGHHPNHDQWLKGAKEALAEPL